MRRGATSSPIRASEKTIDGRGQWSDDRLLLGAADIRRLAAELDVTPTKKLGQNFVVDANTVRKIVQAADVQPSERVVEIGPGLGSLTLAILETGRASPPSRSTTASPRACRRPLSTAACPRAR
jgi:hypothetical protein